MVQIPIRAKMEFSWADFLSASVRCPEGLERSSNLRKPSGISDKSVGKSFLADNSKHLRRNIGKDESQ